MSEFTDLILSKKDENTSVRQHLLKLGIDQQKFNGWINGAMPDDKTVAKVSEEFGIDFLLLYSMAKVSGRGGRGTSTKALAEWRKIYKQKKDELSIEKEKKGMKIAININAG